MSRIPNPFRALILYIGLALARIGVIDRERAVETTVLAWPRIITGIARMSKNAVDVAMVGIGIGTSAVAGVGFAGPFWGLAFAIGGGIAGGTIAMVSQRYGAEAYDELGIVVRASALLVVVISLPVMGLYWLFPYELISALSSNEQAIEHGTTYLQIIAWGIPFAGLNLIASRTFVGADDSYTAMQIRGCGAISNVGFNAVFILVFEWGVAGAALGTVLSNVIVTATFAIGMSIGQLPGLGEFPIQVPLRGTYLDRSVFLDLIKIGFPIGARNLIWTVAEFPMLAIVDIFGENTVAAFVIARRIWQILNTPGWGFGLASSSLVGQALGKSDERMAKAYGNDIIRFAVVTYTTFAVLIALFAEQIVVLFAENPNSPEIPIAVSLVYAACFAVPFQGFAKAAAGPLDVSGDTQVTFISQLLGIFCGAIPLTYLGATTQLGYWGLYLAFSAETIIPAAINYWRFRTDKWKTISETYRSNASISDD